MQTVALVVAAGSGERLGGGVPKQYRPLGGKPVVRRACEALLAHPRVAAVRVVIGPGQETLAAAALDGLDVGAPVLGGARRQDSVRRGLEVIAGDAVLIHDAARPFCPPDVVDRLLDALGAAPGAVPVLLVADTLTRGGKAVDRDGLVRVQTPQAFRLDAIRAAHGRFADEATDDAGVLRAAGRAVAEVAGDAALEKLTAADDWARAEAMLAGRMVSRTGTGFDVHAFGGPGPLMVGGIAIPHEQGVLAHSDGDVALHALTDALLGAAAEGDIGLHFPPSDERWRGPRPINFSLMPPGSSEHAVGSSITST